VVFIFGGFEMSDAIVVTNAYKKFGKADDPIWTRVPWLKSGKGRNDYSAGRQWCWVSSPYLLACGCLAVWGAMPSALENYTATGKISILVTKNSGATEEVEDADHE
jgi:hypothetical protein